MLKIYNWMDGWDWISKRTSAMSTYSLSDKVTSGAVWRQLKLCNSFFPSISFAIFNF